MNCFQATTINSESGKIATPSRVAKSVIGALASGLMLVSGAIQAQTTVTITSPTDGGHAPVRAAISPAAAVAGAKVDRVRFKKNGATISAGDTAAPYTDSFTPTTPGKYVIVAEALVRGAVVATSKPVTVTVGGIDMGAPFVGYESLAAGTQTKTASPSVGSGTSTTSAASAEGVTSSSASAGFVSVTRTFVYDANERLCKAIDPEAGATVIDYDAAGNIAWKATGTTLMSATCDRHNVTAAMKSTRTYDAMNRLTGVATPDGIADSTTTYTPDGLVASITQANSWNGSYPVTTTYAYNKRRMLQSETSSQPAWYNWTVGYGYNANGHLSALTYPMLFTVGYAPNALGQPTQVGAFASGISYYPNGAIKQFTYGNGIVHTMIPNLRGLPTRSRDMNGATPVLDDSYAFDANGNVADIIDQAQGTSRGMAYDPLDRLTTAVSTGTPTAPMWGTAQYTYDAVDNLRSSTLGMSGYNYGYDTNNRLSTLTRVSGGTYFYATDSRGNVTSDGRQSYDWDAANRLLAVTNKEYYRYDGLGRRALSWRPTGPLSLFMYSQSGQLLHTHDGTRGEHLSHIYLGNTLLAIHAVPFNTVYESVRYQHTDGLGSPVAVTDSNRNVVERTVYAPYGAPVNRPVEGVGYTGHVMDQTTGLTYMQQRYYDPQSGRFISRDPMPVISSQNFNRYNYANNNPYRFKDPDGRFSRGAGFTDEQWNSYDAAQQGTANALDAAGAQLSAALASGDFSGIDASWNKVFPDGANASNVQEMLGKITATSAALRDTTSTQFVATGMTSSQIGAKYGSQHSNTPAFNVDGTKGMVVNTSRVSSAAPIMLGWIAGHEGLHAATGIRDITNSQGVTAYKFGSTSASRDYFRDMMNSNSSQTLVSPDHIMEFVIPQMNAAFPPSSSP